MWAPEGDDEGRPVMDHQHEKNLELTYSLPFKNISLNVYAAIRSTLASVKSCEPSPKKLVASISPSFSSMNLPFKRSPLTPEPTQTKFDHSSSLII